MKANIPEKIYLPIDDSLKTYARKDSDEEIEYIKKDAFIKKACGAYCAICDTKECDGCAECTWVIKFRRQLLKY